MPGTDILGPIDYLAVEFPSGRMTGAGFRLVREPPRRGTIVVMDLEFVRKGHDGTLSRVALEDVPLEHPMDVSAWVGMSSGLLDEDDVRTVGEAIDPGSRAGILVCENAWAAPIMAGIGGSGARLPGSGRDDANDSLGMLGPDATRSDGAV